MHLFLEALKQFNQACQKKSISITQEKGFIWANLYKLSNTNVTKDTKSIPVCTAKRKGFRTEIRKKLNDEISFINLIINIEEMSTYFKDKHRNSKKRYKNYKTLNTITEPADTIVFIVATSTSIVLLLFGVGLATLPTSAEIACSLSLGNKVLHKMIINKYNKYKKQYQKDQQTLKFYDEIYRKSLQDNLLHKNEYESLCEFFTK